MLQSRCRVERREARHEIAGSAGSLFNSSSKRAGCMRQGLENPVLGGRVLTCYISITYKRDTQQRSHTEGGASWTSNYRFRPHRLPVAEVFEAVADPAILSEYFATGGAKGRAETGATVMWTSPISPARSPPVEVVEVVPNEKIVLRWDANEENADDDKAGSRDPGYQPRSR